MKICVQQRFHLNKQRSCGGDVWSRQGALPQVTNLMGSMGPCEFQVVEEPAIEHAPSLETLHHLKDVLCVGDFWRRELIEDLLLVRTE